MFDVFIEKQKNGNLLFFSGSEKGQILLENNKIRDYENIEFAGLVPEQGANAKIGQNRKAVENSLDHKVWDELAEICLACGKCSMVCPTCFCFDTRDEATFDGVEKVREKASCFYPEFSETAGGKKDLDSVKKRLYFWYYHKFVRIPEELSYYGCVSCMRCFKVCPVGINIVKNLQNLQVLQK
jgi:ferredoxin